MVAILNKGTMEYDDTESLDMAKVEMLMTKGYTEEQVNTVNNVLIVVRHIIFSLLIF